MSSEKASMSAPVHAVVMRGDWRKISEYRWERHDNAVVKMDTSTELNTSRPWLPNYRGWIAFGPGSEEHNYLGFKRRNSPLLIPRKFKTAEATMSAVDRESA